MKGYDDWLQLADKVERQSASVRAVRILVVVLACWTMALATRTPPTRFVEIPTARFVASDPATLNGPKLPRFCDGMLIRSEDFNQIVAAIEELQRRPQIQIDPGKIKTALDDCLPTWQGLTVTNCGREPIKVTAEVRSE